MTKNIAPAVAHSFMDKEQLEKAIASILTHGAKLDKMVQAAAVSALNHAEVHNDLCFVNRLYLAMNKGSRRSSLAMWFLAFGKIQANIDAGTKSTIPFLWNKGGLFQLEAAIETQWYEMKKDTEPDALFDIQKAVQFLIAKAKKSAKVNDPGMLASLETLASLTAKGKETPVAL